MIFFKDDLQGFVKEPYVMFCAIWYHLCNLKNVKNTHGGVLVLVKLQGSRNTSHALIDCHDKIHTSKSKSY